MTKAQTAGLTLTTPDVVGSGYQVAVALPNTHFVLSVEGDLIVRN